MKTDFSGQRRLAVALAAIIMVMFSAASCFADSVTLSIPVSHRFKGNEYKGRDVFSFTLTAEDGAPMPSGSGGDSKTISIHAGEKPDFGSISFSKPDIYHYVVSREREDHTRIKEDDSRYRVTVAVLSDMSSELTYTKIGGSSVKDSSGKNESGKTESILYTDIYEATPKTGDTAASAILIVSLGMLCAGILLLMLAVRRKEDSGDERI